MDIGAEQTMIGSWKKPLELLNGPDIVNICAPMVRYSKLSFRKLVRKYNCDLAFTPMIISNSFVKSQKARDADFSTCEGDRPLIVQFAANNAYDFSAAAEIVYPLSDGVDLNCGCPQRWAMAEGYGANLIYKPDLLCDLVKQTRSKISDPEFTVSVKMRILANLRETVDLCQKAEKAGVSFLSVHGRTKYGRTCPNNIEAIKLIKDSVSIPVIANGDIKTLQDAQNIVTETGVNGVMSARGILTNPAMYTGVDLTPIDCIQQWLDITKEIETPYSIYHHHLIYMIEKLISRAQRRIFNPLTTTPEVLDFLLENFGVS